MWGEIFNTKARKGKKNGMQIRRNKNYQNKRIDRNRSILNASIITQNLS